MNRILLVDDDIALTDMLREYLELEGFVVDCVHDGAEALRTDLEGRDLIVLDVMLPNLSGFELLKRLRQRGEVPIIMLTARDDDVDRIVGLEMGADDYVSKPVNPRELIGRIRAVLRRSVRGAVPPNGELAVGQIRIDPSARNVWCGDRKLELTSAEFNLLEHMLRNAGRIVSRDELSAAAFGRHHTAGADRNVDTLVSKVRRKLGPSDDDDQRIKTVRNVGYIFARPATGPGSAESGELAGF